MSKVRVYEVAKQLGIDEQAAITLLQQQGAPVRNRLSAVTRPPADGAISASATGDACMSRSADDCHRFGRSAFMEGGSTGDFEQHG